MLFLKSAMHACVSGFCFEMLRDPAKSRAALLNLGLRMFIGSSPHYWESIEKLTALALGFFLIGGLLYHRRLKKSRVIVHQTC